jgi:hypothetical protein
MGRAPGPLVPSQHNRARPVTLRNRRRKQGIDDATIAAATDLARRTGATGFHVWQDTDGWGAQVTWPAGSFTVQGLDTSTDAALALTLRMIYKGRCRCGQVASIADRGARRCTWEMTNGRWEPSCLPEGKPRGRDLTIAGTGGHDT